MTPIDTGTGKKLSRKKFAALLGLPLSAVRHCTDIRIRADRITFRCPVDEETIQTSAFAVLKTAE